MMSWMMFRRGTLTKRDAGDAGTPLYNFGLYNFGSYVGGLEGPKFGAGFGFLLEYFLDN